MEQQNGEHIIGEISKRKFKTHNLCQSLLSGLDSQPLQMLKENLKTHIVCEDYIRTSSHLICIIIRC